MPEEGWTPVSNGAAQDHRTSWRAKGLLTELLSYPDGWDTNIDKLVLLGQQAGGHAEGRDAMRTAMNELIQAGYVRRVRCRGKRGEWTTELEVCDAPIYRPTENPASGNQSSEIQASGNQSSADQASITKTDSKTNTKTDAERPTNQYSASLASLAAGADAPAEDSEENQLNRVYVVIDNLDQDDRRRHLLGVERRRPKIYREARHNAIKQIEHSHPQALKEDISAEVIDKLSYKYMARHYSPAWPRWFTRPLEDAWRRMPDRP